jgi:uncharacterized protein YjbI with pentapeptide repeats
VANEEHVKILKQGVEAWNAWRDANRGLRPDLSHANLRFVNLGNADLRRADLTAANLANADLRRADLTDADLTDADLTRAHLTKAKLPHDMITSNLTAANLSGANLTGAQLYRAILIEANLSGAILHFADLRVANLRGANLTHAVLFETSFAGVDLRGVTGLETCKHLGQSTIDHRTLQKSGPLPLAFLRGVGLPDKFIELSNQAIQHYSCFISYSTKDQEFAERLHGDLQNKGVRCWFAPHDLRIGANTLDAIDKAIKLRDSLLLILSENSIKSDWVKDEVQKAFAEERDRKQPVLFPIRLDEAVMKTEEAWARKLRDQRHIGDFRQWKDHDAYQASFQRMLRDLTREQSAAPRGTLKGDP